VLYLKSGIKIEFRKPAVVSSKPTSHVAKSRATFNNSDLPKGTLRLWQTIYLPAWYQYLGGLKNPWSLSGDQLPEAQRIWDRVFPCNHQTLAVTGEAIFSLVSLIHCSIICLPRFIFIVQDQTKVIRVARKLCKYCGYCRSRFLEF
jgi:hypothetical protein